MNDPALYLSSPMNIEQPATKFSLEEEDDSTEADTRGSIEITDALQLLDVDEGRKISTKADHLPRDAFFAYLLLRHLRIRDIRYKVIKFSDKNLLVILQYFNSV